MTIDQNSLIALAVILSVTLIGVIALMRNTDTKLRIDIGENKSFILEGNKPLSEKTKVDCLPGEENSQLQRCDSQ